MSSRASRIQRDRRTHAPLFITMIFVAACIGICAAGVIGVVRLFGQLARGLTRLHRCRCLRFSGANEDICCRRVRPYSQNCISRTATPSHPTKCRRMHSKQPCSIEDERFYEHNGVDLPGIARAVVVNITSGSTEGASTITQQLVRNTILLDEMTDITLERKGPRGLSRSPTRENIFERPDPDDVH